MKKILSFLSLSLFSIAITAQDSVVSENFDDVTTLSEKGWKILNVSESAGTRTWEQGKVSYMSSQEGNATSYIASPHQSVNMIGLLSNWLITPNYMVKDGDVLSFYTRTPADSDKADRLQVRMSVGNSYTPPTNGTNFGSFTNLLHEINPFQNINGYPKVWTKISLTISGVGPVKKPVNFAMIHYVQDAGLFSAENGYYIGIDSFSLSSKQSEPFPFPYCKVDILYDVEPITRVRFSNIDNSSDPVVNNSPAHEDFTSIVGKVTRGTVYPIYLEGNTNNDFANASVFIDWNQNGVLDDDEGEIYMYRTAFQGSNGEDGVKYINYIQIPYDAKLGKTRLRIVKHWDFALGIACSAHGYGQAEDYTLDIQETGSGCTTSSNGQFPSSIFTPACSYNPEIITSDAKASQYSFVNTTKGKTYKFSTSIASDFITITNENASQVYTSGTGNVIWTAKANETIRYYIHKNEACETDSNIRTKKIECFNPDLTPINDTCDKSIEVHVGDEINGSTTYATDSGGDPESNELGNDVYYKLTGAKAGDFVTISLCGSSLPSTLFIAKDCSFKNLIAKNSGYCGEQPQVTFKADGQSTYYIKVDGYYFNAGDFTMKIWSNPDTFTGSCSDMKVESQSIDMPVVLNNARSIAFDIPVGESAFTFYGINIVAQDGNNFNFNLYDEQNELPGNIIKSVTGTVLEKTLFAEILGNKFYNYKIGFNSALNLDSNKRYWLELKSDVYTWNAVVDKSLGRASAMKGPDTNQEWKIMEESFGSVEVVYSLICNMLAVSETNHNRLQLYPNPTNGIVKINTKEKVDIKIYDISGKKIKEDKANIVDISSFPSGVYYFNVNGETTKIIKQ
ncbi:choice-of-anchor J domain-containing protein [Soonwooa sp.]|uniref:T9SS-dependent choice-of-anchor J family protein n=1 Tax=Soonwooa sp. TaxID=1938592 RepID=UPI0026035700|nr:choice-of-anchor J domain-containing protein [Soonwooa sp.]